MLDLVNHPSHYKTVSPTGLPFLRALGVDEALFDRECIDAIESLEHNCGWPYGKLNAVKYLWRAGHKGDVQTDLAKAAWYLERYLQHGKPIALSVYLRVENVVKLLRQHHA